MRIPGAGVDKFAAPMEVCEMDYELLYKCFQDLSKALGLVVNADKSSIFFGGVNADMQQEILQVLGFSKWTLPVRYLGVPLSTKRLSLVQCQHLIEKMLGRIQSWTSRFLSDAGRIQLIKNVLFSIQKALLAWDKLCQPKVAGGLNLLDIEAWNKAAVCKLLWNLCKKKDKMWVQWIHIYYKKHNSLWSAEPKQASWIMQRILKAKKRKLDIQKKM
ncbi:uncharacterized protein LOC142167100 [Nicotiana tabacum]|uniref:Uncharacterized protein LOC142167100 n=1 Tax=Nicotiana tabacum TaxID=4097 RepID=A0AC58SEF5_TOBAC